jgi:hypothetical protein
MQVAGDGALKKTTEPFLSRIERLAKRYEGVKPAVRTLKDKPDDPQANRIVGAFWCLGKEEWKKGLPLLARSDEKALADAARMEQDEPTAPAKQAALGDAWFELANKHAEYRSAMQQRAGLWYTKALLALTDKEKERVENLTDKEKERVEKRVVDLTKSHPERRPMWEHLDLSSRILVVGDAFLRVGVGQFMSAKKPPGGSIEITTVLRTVKNPPRFEFVVLGHTQVIVEMNDNQLTVRRKASAVGGQRGDRVSPRPFTFVPNQWYKIACRLTEDGLEILLDNRSVVRDPGKYNLPRSLPVKMVSTAETLEVSSFTVKVYQP